MASACTPSNCDVLSLPASTLKTNAHTNSVRALQHLVPARMSSLNHLAVPLLGLGKLLKLASRSGYSDSNVDQNCQHQHARRKTKKAITTHARHRRLQTPTAQTPPFDSPTGRQAIATAYGTTTPPPTTTAATARLEYHQSLLAYAKTVLIPRTTTQLRHRKTYLQSLLALFAKTVSIPRIEKKKGNV